MKEGTSRAQRALMVKLDTAPTAVQALEEWIGYPGVVTYDRYWSSLTHTVTVDEMADLDVGPSLPRYKRIGFLRRGVGGDPLAFVEAVILRQYLPPWAVFELDNSNMTIGEMIIGRMGGSRHTLSVEPVSEFDRTGEPLCIKARARLDAVPYGYDEPARPLAVVTERIYERALEMRW